MKKFLMAALGLVCAFGAQAEGDWRATLGKVKDLGGDTGIAGFVRKGAFYNGFAGPVPAKMSPMNFHRLHLGFVMDIFRRRR